MLADYVLMLVDEALQLKSHLEKLLSKPSLSMLPAVRRERLKVTYQQALRRLNRRLHKWRQIRASNRYSRIYYE